MKVYFFLFQYRMEGFVWISLSAIGMQDSFAAQAIFKCLARILAFKVAVQNDHFCISHIQAGILYRFHCQFPCHRCPISIANDFAAAQLYDRSQIGPSFFLYMDVGNIIYTPLKTNYKKGYDTLCEGIRKL